MDLKTTVTHRINSLSLQDSSYITKGDANKSVDLSEVRKGNILGKVIFSIPYLGFVLNFTKSQTGLIFIIIIPAVLIIYSELLNIKNEAKKLIKVREKKKFRFAPKVIHPLEGRKIKFDYE
jgi:signal peptidase I